MAKDIIEDILTILVIISFLVAIFMLLWRIFGDSPTILDLIISILSGLLLYVFKIEYSRGKFEGKFETFVHYTKESFSRVKDDITNLRNEMKEGLSSIKTEIKEDISKLRTEIKPRKR